MGQWGRALPPRSLEAVASRLAESATDTEHDWTRGRLRSYTRLEDTDYYDAWLIAWSPSSSLELHDHGGSQGAVAVLAGKLVETYTDLRWRHPIRTRLVTAQSTIPVPSTVVHEVSNPGPEEALSVHVYSPPLRSMTFFDARPDRFLSPISTSEGDLVALDEMSS